MAAIPFIVIGIVIIYAIYLAASGNWKHSQEDQQKIMRAADEMEDIGASTESTAVAQRKACELESLIDEYGEHMSQRNLAFLKDNLKEVKDNLHSLNYDKMTDKLDTILQKFQDEYLYLTQEQNDTFKQSEKMMASKTKCLKYWQQYWDTVCVPDSPVYGKQYLAEFMGCDYDPCMEHKESLDAKLTEAIGNASEEVKRKRKAFTKIIDYVYESDSVLRADLLRKEFQNINNMELTFCYRQLKNSGKLIEYKLANRIFVTVSDKERSKRDAKKQKVQLNKPVKQVQEE